MKGIELKMSDSAKRMVARMIFTKSVLIEIFCGWEYDLLSLSKVQGVYLSFFADLVALLSKFLVIFLNFLDKF